MQKTTLPFPKVEPNHFLIKVRKEDSVPSFMRGCSES